MAMDSFNHLAAFIAVRVRIDYVRNARQQVETGTGFFYPAKIELSEDDVRMKLLLISNRHVLRGGLEKMTITLNRKKGDGTPDYGVPRIFTYERFMDLYFGHPDKDVDLACVDVSSITHSDAFIKHIGEDFLTPIDYNKVALGSDVLFVGYPNDYYDTAHNLPLVRKGTLASMPSIDFMGKGNVIIDAQVFGGSSGSPVFVDWDGKYRLIGVIESTTEGRTPSGFPAVLGLGQIIKQRHVRELIDHAVNRIKEARGIAQISSG